VRALEIYSREPVAGPPRLFDAADYAAGFDATPVPDFPLRRVLSGVVPQVRLETPWASGFTLRGFDLDRARLGPGDLAFVTLYWRAERALPPGLVPAVVVHDAAGNELGELASTCGGMPSDAWHSASRNETPFRLLADELPPGEYTLLAGVRDSASGAWLPLADGSELRTLAQVSIGR
jgi:hypothetical protein